MSDLADLAQLQLDNWLQRTAGMQKKWPQDKNEQGALHAQEAVDRALAPVHIIHRCKFKSLTPRQRTFCALRAIARMGLPDPFLTLFVLFVDA